MTLTRSKTGHTPKRPENPGYVETPGRSRRVRKSAVHDDLSSEKTSAKVLEAETNDHLDDTGSGSLEKRKPRRKSTANGKVPGKAPSKEDHKVDTSGHFEFGGSLGVSAMMIGFPLLMWYMWVGATYYDGKLPSRTTKNQSIIDFAKHLVNLAYVGAFPNLKAWAIYWVFGVFEALCYLYMPFGVYAWGKPLSHLGGKKLQYYCSGVPSFYLAIALAVLLDRTGIFPLDTLIDEFGPIMSVAIISGFIVSVIAYISAVYRGATHRMTGYPVYDFFMGAELNPRMLQWLDFKMFFEVRLPWFMLFFTTLGACKKQYSAYGYVSGELGFLLMAHWLYANACCKGEELIPPTWDMYYEKWGFMLIFWNMAGVPLSYCHCTIYLVNHDPATYRWSKPFLIFLYASYLFAYWIWDTAGSQKNTFRAEQRGTIPQRSAFPQLPFRKVKNPQTIPVASGDDLLCDGWYKYARKIHYTCDIWFSFCWGLVTGFSSPFPWFYPVFFLLMIAHRAQRDIHRCRERYGKSWEEYEKRVPYLFIPYVF